MKSIRRFMMRVLIEMPVKIRCGIGAEEDDSSVIA